MSRGTIWSQLPVKQAPAESDRPFRWVVNITQPFVFTFIVGLAVLLPASLNPSARISLFIFAATIIFWVTTSINGAYIAVVAMLTMVVTGVTSQDDFFQALGTDVIWLMVGAFVLGASVLQTGLAARLTSFVVARAGTVRGVFWLLTSVLIPLALIIPSTSGRAAIAIPVFRGIATSANHIAITRALAILIPTVILVSTIGSLIAAGSHLITIDLLERLVKQKISYSQWILYGLPFAIIASYLSTACVLRLFLTPGQRSQSIQMTPMGPCTLSLCEKKTLCIVVLLIGLWLTERWHGLEIATVTMIGALLLTFPGFGVLTWKKGLSSVSWNLVIFVAAAIVMGETLIKTGAAKWIVQQLFHMSGIMSIDNSLLFLLILSLISLTSHLYITSHSARAVALVPALLFLAESLQLNPVAVLFIGTVGMDYCQSFPVSSKALLMFYELEEQTYRQSDLLKLSSVLLVMHILLIIVFYFSYWQWVGLQF